MYFAFFDVFIAVAVVVATALYFDLKGTVSDMEKSENKCINLYLVRNYQLLQKCSCFAKRYFLHIWCKGQMKIKLSSLNEDMKNHEYFVI